MVQSRGDEQDVTVSHTHVQVTALRQQKGPEIRKHVDPGEGKENTAFKPLFLPSGRQRAVVRRVTCTLLPQISSTDFMATAAAFRAS